MPDANPNEPSPDFYVGYLPTPPSQQRAIRWSLAALTATALLTSLLFALGQRDPGGARWDADPTEWAGTLIADPYPMLRTVDRETATPVTAILVREGKCGLIETAEWCGPPPGLADNTSLRETLAPLNGKRITCSARALRRDGALLLELADSTDGIFPLRLTTGSHEEPDTLKEESLGLVFLSGEIVDPKCYFGAMKPGDGATHRACAIRCIRGGIPPMLVTHDDFGHLTPYLLIMPDGSPANESITDLIGAFIDIDAEVSRRGDVLFARLVRAGLHRR